MVAVLSNPEKYDGKRISLDGILHAVMEDDTLYLNREMADSLLKINGVGLNYNKVNLKLIPNVHPPSVKKKVSLGYFNNKLCNVFGTFNAKNKALDNVTCVLEDNIVVKKH
ncbi:MAG TPA: hypothetical protein V6C76_09665 [Drouetiella sp.]